MSETKQMREAWIYAGTDGLWKLALDVKYVWSNTPEKLKVREVSAEYDAAVGDLSEFINVFLYTNHSRGYPTGSEWLELVRIAERAREAYDAASKGLK